MDVNAIRIGRRTTGASLQARWCRGSEALIFRGTEGDAMVLRLYGEGEGDAMVLRLYGEDEGDAMILRLYGGGVLMRLS